MSPQQTHSILGLCFLLFIPVLCSNIGDSRKHLEKDSLAKIGLPAVSYELAFSLMPNYGEVITFAEVTVHKGKIVGKKHISQEEFILMGTGGMTSKANPQKTNLFLKYGVNMCKSEYDSSAQRYLGSCHVLDNLWKLRHQTKPGDFEKDQEDGKVENAPSSERGWSHFKHAPDAAQLAKLSEFGIQRMNDFAVGANAFRLIKAANDPNWVRNY